MKKVLLDTNLLIAAFDSSATTSPDEKAKAVETLTSLLSDADTKIVITPLIRYEVLRGIQWEDSDRYNKVKEVLNDFVELDITRNVSELASNLYRFDLQSGLEGRNLDKRKFDVFHFSTAQCNHLDFASQDTDIAKIGDLYYRYQSHLTS